MAPSIDRLFLDCSVQRFTQLAGRVDDCLSRLDDAQMWIRGGQNENALGNIVLHLCGNVRQWILSGIGGAPDVRDRDAEFAATGGPGVKELSERLAATVREAGAVIADIDAERLAEKVRIQGYDVTVLEAIYHVVEHFAQHTGQIIFLTKALTGADLGYYGYLKGKAHGLPTP